MMKKYKIILKNKINLENNFIKKDGDINDIKISKATNAASIGHDDLDYGLDWLCKGSNSILDFECGNGVWLIKCFLRGTKTHFGIDSSCEGIRIAKEIQKETGEGNFIFTVG